MATGIQRITYSDAPLEKVYETTSVTLSNGNIVHIAQTVLQTI